MFVFIKQFAKKFLKLAFKKAIFCTNFEKSCKIEVMIATFIVRYQLWGDVTSSEIGVPPLVTSCHLFGGPPTLPLWGDVIYGWSLSTK